MIRPPSFDLGAYKTGLFRSNANLFNFAALESLLADLRDKGMDPRVDAALAALSQQEIAALDHALDSPATAGPSSQKHSRL